MINALDILWGYIYDFWYYLINELMITNSWESPKLYDNILDGELLRINLTWVDLSSLLAVITIILLIYLFIKFFVKVLGIFVWK